MSAPAPGRQTGSFGDELTNAAMIGLIGVFALALLLRGAGSVAAFLTGTAQPPTSPRCHSTPRLRAIAIKHFLTTKNTKNSCFFVVKKSPNRIGLLQA